MREIRVAEATRKPDGVDPRPADSQNSEPIKKVTSSFASVLQNKPMRKAVKIKELRSEEVVEGATMTLPFEAVEEVSSRFANTLYGYFIGKRLAFPLVENYVKNTWAKYGLKRVQLHEDFFLFQFDTREGMESVLENGPWLICLVPLILNVWSPDADLIRINLKPYTMFLLLPILRLVLALSLLKLVSAEKELMESIVIAIPLGKDQGHSLATIEVEYTRQPPRCSMCLVFDHVTDMCPEIPKEVTTKNVEPLDGFKKKKNKVHQPPKKKQMVGVRVGKSQSNKYYRRVENRESSKITKKVQQKENTPSVTITNSFVALEGDDDDGEQSHVAAKQGDQVLNISDSEVDEEILVDDRNGIWKTKGASTPINESPIWRIRIFIGCVRLFLDTGTGLLMVLGVLRVHHKLYVHNRPWCLMGDFNDALYLEDSTAGASSIDISMREFKECVADIEVLDVQKSSLMFTWSQKPKGRNRILKKLDRVMANLKFNDSFVGAHAVFKPYRVSDHSPSVLNIPTLKQYAVFVDLRLAVASVLQYSTIVSRNLSLSNLYNNLNPYMIGFWYCYLTRNDRFLGIVNEVWNQQVSGFIMFRVVKKLMFLKKPFRKLLYEKGNLHANVVRLRDELDSVQTLLDNDPFNASLRDKEAACVVAFNEAAILEERFLKQKAKVHWLKEGDSNSAYFHKAVKSRISRSHIDVVTNAERIIFENENISDAFVAHYEAFLGLAEAWEIVSNDITDAVREFFTNGKLLKELNHTIIALIPKKAYDTVDWDFLRRILYGFGFHARMALWIMECVSTTSYSICINGNLHGYFQGNRGLRQGDPLSPYLFTLVMEVLTIMLHRRVLTLGSFTFNRHCSKLDLINLCFADDLFLFSYGDFHSACIIKEALDEFKNASGLTPSLPKSTTYFCNVLNHVKTSILNVLPFEEGRLLVKYLGVPLVLSRLMVRDCKELVEKVQNRIQDWKNKTLSIAGRLQLVSSVIGSMHVYGASVFIIPTSVLLDIEMLMRGFLWCQGIMKRGKAKVAWEVVCLPKKEGGLGIRRLDHFNSALMVAHVWKLLTLKESFWVKWIHEYKLKGRSFWEVPLRGNMSWSWRKILQLRLLIRESIWTMIGDGSSTSLWFDRWCDIGPLCTTIYTRDIYRAGITPLSRVKDIVHNGTWNWSTFLLEKYPFLDACTTPIVDGSNDMLVWRTSLGVTKDFSVNQLKMQDLICSWDVSSALGTVCSLCEVQSDSHEHLFFECSFSQASMIQNIEGKTIGKDGKPWCPIRKVVRVLSAHDENPNMVGYTAMKDNISQGDDAAHKAGESSKNVTNIQQQGMKPMGVNSFALVLQPKPTRKIVKITELRNEESVEGAVVAIPFDAVEEISSRFTHTLYGYFIGKRFAFPLVENYVKNTWAKYGVKRIQLHDDFFLFQFESKDGMDSVLENGPWLIRMIPLILNVWSPNTDLKKAKVKKAPVWNFTIFLLSTYARALIEVLAENELMELLVIAIPVGKDKGHTLATIDIKYEWKPPRCSTCMIFNHTTDKCPKLSKEVLVTNAIDEGFMEVKKKKHKNKSRPQHQINGIRLTKPPPKMYYRRVEKGELSESNAMHNTGTRPQSKKHDDVLNVSDSEVDEEILVEERNGIFNSGWNHNDVDVVVITQDDQAIHTRVWLKAERKEVLCSFIYAYNRYNQRRSLWRSLSQHKIYIRDRPLCLLGDFNVALFLEDSTASGSRIDISMCEFHECVEDIEVMDV
ncbi:hypothetical protein Tco_0205110 [Tanacetum coccineum]